LGQLSTKKTKTVKTSVVLLLAWVMVIWLIFL